jgi:hypothetical protein
MKPKKLRKLYAAKLRWQQKKLQRPFWNDGQFLNHPEETSKLVTIYAIR